MKTKYPIGGFAKGSYSCKCNECNESFTGDKRAFQCEPCAINIINRSNTESLDELAKLKKALKLVNQIMGYSNH